MNLQYVNKPVNNVSYEWGRNCAMLGYDREKTLKCIDAFNGFASADDEEQFWAGYEDGPREDNTVISLPAVGYNG